MNERIKELWLDGAQSLWPRPGKCTAGEYDYNLEKFAELIIRECANIAWQHTPETEDLEYSHLIKDKILENFGVEE
jgi:hypothetical protein